VCVYVLCVCVCVCVVCVCVCCVCVCVGVSVSLTVVGGVAHVIEAVISVIDHDGGAFHAHQGEVNRRNDFGGRDIW
jgi:hypothetical protein